MKICGIIVEYNPFHNGHIHHIKETKRITKCDYIVAIMSGNFVQRGEPACIDKFKRAELATLYGVDLVIELPYVFATQSADNFALGAIKLLNNIGVTSICFGSESGDLSYLKNIHSITNTENFKAKMKSFLKEGFSYPKSFALSLNIENIKPNNILGLSYLKAIDLINNNIKPYTIKRIDSNYHDNTPTNNKIASATAIRKLNFENKDYSNYVPNHPYLMNSFNSWNNFSQDLLYRISILSKNELKSLFLVDEGIENKLFNLMKTKLNHSELISNLVSKRYTRSKINRMLLHILLNIKKDDINKIDILNYKNLRILATSSNGINLIKHIDLTKNAKFIKVKDNYDKIIDIEIKVSKVYALRTNYLFKREFMHMYIGEKK